MFDVRSLVLFLWHRQKNYSDLQKFRLDASILWILLAIDASSFFSEKRWRDRYAVDVDWDHSCSLWHGPLDVDHVRAKTRKVETGIDLKCLFWILAVHTGSCIWRIDVPSFSPNPLLALATVVTRDGKCYRHRECILLCTGRLSYLR